MGADIFSVDGVSVYSLESLAAGRFPDVGLYTDI